MLTGNNIPVTVQKPWMDMKTGAVMRAQEVALAASDCEPRPALGGRLAAEGGGSFCRKPISDF